MNVKSNKVAAILAAQAARPRNKFVMTEAMKEKMIAQEPTEAQIERLQKYKLNGVRLVSDDELLTMTKLDASERIDQIEVEFERLNAGPVPTEWVDGLLKWGVTEAEIAGLTRGEAKELFQAFNAAKKAKAAAKESK